MEYTPLVVTLWYHFPELMLGSKVHVSGYNSYMYIHDTLMLLLFEEICHKVTTCFMVEFFLTLMTCSHELHMHALIFQFGSVLIINP